MFNILSVVRKPEELKLNFIYEGEGTYSALDTAGTTVGKIRTNGATLDADSDDIVVQYKLWTTRPERKVGKKVEIQGQPLPNLVDVYEELLTGAVLRSDSSTDESLALRRCKSALEWLRTTDFYSAPASTQYHDSFPGGLLVHSLNVYNHAMELLCGCPSFSSVDMGQAALAALVHDWCKIQLYEQYEKNVKDDATGRWTKEAAYRINMKGIPLGHGATSLYLASRCFNLAPETACAIRWHQGEYNVCPNEMNELHECNKRYPLSYLVQFADRLACTEYANTAIERK